MVRAIVLTILFLLAVIGICEIIYVIKMIVNYPSKKVSVYSLIVLNKGHSILQLNYIWQKFLWHGNSFACFVIALVDEIDENELIQCKDFIKQKNIILCYTHDLINLEKLMRS